MTASLPSDVQAVCDRFVTTEPTTIDALGLPKKARDARANPLVALPFSGRRTAKREPERRS